MCGILGHFRWALNSNLTAPDAMWKALRLMHHRGPDAMAVKTCGDCAVLGHARLKIIDLSDASNQPLEKQGCFIVFNGELYNYQSIRNDLCAKGWMFQSDGDTEVVLTAYLAWGPDCVARFNGMWAFAIVDSLKRELFCSRDRFGVKPFNFAVDSQGIIFASEIKPLLSLRPELRTPNLLPIASYCRGGVGAQHRETWFKGVLRLSPAHNLFVSDAGVREVRYWDYPKNSSTNLSTATAAHEYRELFLDAVRLRLHSDVPVGITLSSGLDSTSIACAAHRSDGDKLHTFTVTFPESDGRFFDTRYLRDSATTLDEASTVGEICHALGFNANFVTVAGDDDLRRLWNTLWHLESGHSSPATLAVEPLMKRVRERVTVVLEGQGADELLGGYVNNLLIPVIFAGLKNGNFNYLRDFVAGYRSEYSLSYGFRMALRSMASGASALYRVGEWLKGTADVLCKELMGETILPDTPYAEHGFDDSLNHMLAQQHAGGLVNLLHYGDALSMAASVESRMPFMDYRLVEFVFSLPSSYKVSAGIGKTLHRTAMSGLVPETILSSRRKLGFPTPISRLFSGANDVSQGKRVLLSDKCMDRGLFKPDTLRKILRQDGSRQIAHSRLLFRLLSVELWFRIFMEGNHWAETTPLSDI